MIKDNYANELDALDVLHSKYLKNDVIQILVLMRIAEQFKRLVDMAEDAKRDQDSYQ